MTGVRPSWQPSAIMGAIRGPSPCLGDAPATADHEHLPMRTKGRRQRSRELRQRWRELRVTARFATRLGRLLALELSRAGVEKGRAYRPQRTVKLGAAAVSLTAAGIAAARIRRDLSDAAVGAAGDKR